MREYYQVRSLSLSLSLKVVVGLKKSHDKNLRKNSPFSLIFYQPRLHFTPERAEMMEDTDVGRLLADQNRDAAVQAAQQVPYGPVQLRLEVLRLVVPNRPSCIRESRGFLHQDGVHPAECLKEVDKVAHVHVPLMRAMQNCETLPVMLLLMNAELSRETPPIKITEYQFQTQIF